MEIVQVIDLLVFRPQHRSLHTLRVFTKLANDSLQTQKYMYIYI
jgi:hypothetical protein